MITVDKQVELFFEAVTLAERGKKKKAHDIFTTLRAAYPDSVQLLIWYAKTCDNTEMARKVLYKAYRRDQENFEIIKAYAELPRIWKLSG